MSEETIVAVYDTAAHADTVIRELEAASVPSSAVSRHAAGNGTTTATGAAPQENGFWSKLFGGEPDHDTSVYGRSVDAGSHVITVKVPETQASKVTAILDRNHPIDMKERAATYGLQSGGTATKTPVAARAMPAPGAGETALRGNEERLSLAEEQVQVGKRLVDRGTTRIRRFVVETPVEEDVTLHSERVSIERRPVAADARVTDADFTDKTIEVKETDEEAVVGKTARVREEVVIRKDAADRVEKVHETVRREDVEITSDGNVKADGKVKAGPGTPGAMVPPAAR